MSDEANSYTANFAKPRGYTKILFFIEGNTVPASRFRALQFKSELEKRNIHAKFLATIPSKYLSLPKYLNFPFVRQLLLGAELIFVILQRLFQIAIWGGWGDVIVLQRELLFRDSSGFLEKFLLLRAGKAKRIVFDVDDAIFLGKDGEISTSQDQKLKELLSQFDLVIAGNNYLESYFSKFTKTVVIPTLLDTEHYKRSEKFNNNPPVIAWTGVESNLPYLSGLKSVLERIYQEQPFKFLIITNNGASNPFGNSIFPVELVAWDSRNEVATLSKADIGIMPLPKTPWAAGKCGFKLLQYMSVQIPSVASAVGVNCEIIKHGENGLLCENHEQWVSNLLDLLRDKDLRKRIGEAGRKRVEDEYSLAKWSEKWVSALLGTSPN